MTPSSNSWLPTLETSRCIALSVSIDGSSWKTPEVNVEPPMRSPAATVKLLAWPLRSWSRWVARYAAPLVVTVRPSKGTSESGAASGSMCPW